MKKILLVVGFLMLLAVPLRAEERGVIQKIVDEAKTWNYSLGDYAYLLKEGRSFYGVGIQKDVGQYIKKIGKDWIYADIGYLNTIGKSSDEKDYAYLGTSVNAGHLIAEGIEWAAKGFGAEIKMPTFLRENMLKVGYIAATRFDDEFFKVWDHGPKVRIIEIKFGGVGN